MKKLRIVLVVLLGLLVAGAIAIWLTLDAAVAKSVEKGGTYALEVPTTVGSASVGVLAGEIGIDDLLVANPDGFRSPHFLSLARAEGGAEISTLMSDRIVIRSIGLSGLDVHLERGEGGTNVSRILDSLKRFESKEPSQRAPDGGGRSKKLVIGELVIRDIAVHSHLLPELGKVGLHGATDATLRIPELRLENLGGDEGLTTAELIAKIVETVLASTLEHGGGVLSGEILKDLAGSLEQLGSGVLEELGRELGGGLGESLEGIEKKLGGELDKIFK
jgi:hypothetical protein